MLNESYTERLDQSETVCSLLRPIVHTYIQYMHAYIRTYVHTWTTYCPNLSAQRDVIKQQTGTWPVRKEDFASKYQKEFSAFVNAIDFDAMQTTV
jgi:membrane-bound lytic murein transglycosylase MltF